LKGSAEMPPLRQAAIPLGAIWGQRDRTLKYNIVIINKITVK